MEKESKKYCTEPKNLEKNWLIQKYINECLSLTNFSIEELYLCEESWNINNGRTLCVPYHKGTDTYEHGTKKLLKQLSAQKD